MDWTITAGDILQVIGFVAVGAYFVVRIDKDVGILRAKHEALEQRMTRLEQGISDDIREIKEFLRSMSDRLDRKADK